MAITQNRNKKNVVVQTEGAAWINEKTATGGVLGAADWVLLDWQTETTVTQDELARDVMGDSGKRIARPAIISGMTIESSFTTSDDEVRKMFSGDATQGVIGKQYGYCFLDAKYDIASTTAQGYWAFYEGTIGLAQEIALADGNRYKLTFYASHNTECAAYTLNLPTDTCFTPTETTISIPAGEFYATEDGTLA